jgi:hypothetical protein
MGERPNMLPWLIWSVFKEDGTLFTVCSSKKLANWFIETEAGRENLWINEKPWLVIRPEMIDDETP